MKRDGDQDGERHDGPQQIGLREGVVVEGIGEVVDRTEASDPKERNSCPFGPAEATAAEGDESAGRADDDHRHDSDDDCSKSQR